MKPNKYDANSVVPRKEPKAKYTLKRLNDGLTHTAYQVQYVEWNKDKTAKESHDDAQIGRSWNSGISNHSQELINAVYIYWLNNNENSSTVIGKLFDLTEVQVLEIINNKLKRK